MAKRPAKSPAIQLRQANLAPRFVAAGLDLHTAPGQVLDDLLKAEMESWAWPEAPDDDQWLESSDLAGPLPSIN